MNDRTLTMRASVLGPGRGWNLQPGGSVRTSFFPLSVSNSQRGFTVTRPAGWRHTRQSPTLRRPLHPRSKLSSIASHQRRSAPSSSLQTSERRLPRNLEGHALELLFAPPRSSVAGGETWRSGLCTSAVMSRIDRCWAPMHGRVRTHVQVRIGSKFGPTQRWT